MKIKNLEIKKMVKTTAVALVTGTMLLTSPLAAAPKNVEASSYTQSSYDVMYYFTDNLQDNVEKYLDKTESSTNLTKLLGYYDTLYDFVNNGKYVRNTYYRNLPYYEQETLNQLLVNWGNEIYDLYRDKSYFKSTCKSKLGFYMTYESQETGYDRDHEETIEKFTETYDENLDTYLDKDNSQTNLKNALNVYKNLVNFIKGNQRVYGYIFSELTITEQQELINLLEDWTYDIEDEYGTYSYYSSSCISKVGWTVNVNNVYNELGEYINGYNNGYNPTYPNYSENPTLPTNPTNPGTIPPAVPTTPSTQVQTPSTQTPSAVTPAPAVPTTGNQQSATAPKINNTVGKDWKQNYIDPSINTSRGERDWTPENVNDVFNTDKEYLRYTQDVRGYYYQNGYYDQYGNFIPYNDYYNNGYYEDSYEDDYVPKYILK